MENPQSQALGIPALEHQHAPPPLQTSVLPGQSMDDAHSSLVTAYQVQLGRFQYDQASPEPWHQLRGQCPAGHSIPWPLGVEKGPLCPFLCRYTLGYF